MIFIEKVFDFQKSWLGNIELRAGFSIERSEIEI